MHESVMHWCRDRIASMERRWQMPMAVLDVGSLDVNGSTRPLVEHLASEYVGIDIREGPGVDIVMDADDLSLRFGERFDLVLCTEMLEHARTPIGTLEQIAHVLVPGGTLLLTARGVATDRCADVGRPHAFGEHGEPHDYWRFMPQSFAMMFELVGLTTVEVTEDPQAPGWFGAARKPA